MGEAWLYGGTAYLLHVMRWYLVPLVGSNSWQVQELGEA